MKLDLVNIALYCVAWLFLHAYAEATVSDPVRMGLGLAVLAIASYAGSRTR